MSDPNEPDEPQTVTEVVADLADLVKAYAKQETVDPLTNLGTWFKFGLPGALLTAFGTVLLVLAALRALQTETDTTFTGNWSWAPYFITLVLAVVVIGLAVLAARKKGNPV